MNWMVSSYFVIFHAFIFGLFTVCVLVRNNIHFIVIRKFYKRFNLLNRNFRIKSTLCLTIIDFRLLKFLINFYYLNPIIYFVLSLNYNNFNYKSNLILTLIFNQMCNLKLLAIKFNLILENAVR